MARIIVSVVPFAGHVAPLTGIVAELVERGHRVTVHTGAKYHKTFTTLGADILPFREAPDFDEHQLSDTFPQVGRRGPVGLLANLEHIFIRSGAGQARDLLKAHREAPFDVVVGDVMTSGSGLFAESAQVPWATISTVPLSLPSADLPPSGLALHPARTAAGRLRNRVLAGVLHTVSWPLAKAQRETRAELGLPPDGKRFDEAWHSPDLVIATGVPGLDYPRSDLPDQVQYVGRLAPAAPPSVIPRPNWWEELVESDLPVVLVTQGTLNIDPADLLLPALYGLRNEKALVILTTAGNRLPQPLPANVRTADYLEFSAVLPYVDVVVSNGGWGGVLAAIAHGIPLIVAGGDLDKPEIAARVAWSGAGVDLRTGHPTADAVTAAYRLIATRQRFKRRAVRLSQELWAAGGVPRAVDLIETLTSNHGEALAHVEQ